MGLKRLHHFCVEMRANVIKVKTPAFQFDTDLGYLSEHFSLKNETIQNRLTTRWFENLRSPLDEILTWRWCRRARRDPGKRQIVQVGRWRVSLARELIHTQGLSVLWGQPGETSTPACQKQGFIKALLGFVMCILQRFSVTHSYLISLYS